jgi:hypothetical protein
VNGEFRFVPYSKKNLESVKDFFTPHTIDPDHVYVYFNIAFERDLMDKYEFGVFEEDYLLAGKDGKKLLFRNHTGSTLCLNKNNAGILRAGERYVIGDDGHIEFMEMITPENRLTVYDFPVISCYSVKVKVNG